MSNAEARRNAEIRSLKATPRVFGIRASSLFRHSAFELRHFLHSSFRNVASFTIIELLVVISIIIILAGLILSTVGYVQKKGARARAEAEIAAMSAALESYKADNGIYPRDGNTDVLFAITDTSYAGKTPPDPKPTSYDASVTEYKNASFFLYGQLSGNTSGDRTTQILPSYFQFKPNMLSPVGGTGTVTAIRDPFGNNYGYSTSYQADAASGHSPIRGFNPTYDFWSTGGESNASKAAYEQGWIKNW
jgi:type II secretory pathway pseudopilin PulG